MSVDGIILVEKRETRTVLVRCTFELRVEVDASMDEDAIRFMIEENSCPGTGMVGAALDAAIERGDATGFCWACPTGENEIVSFDPL